MSLIIDILKEYFEFRRKLNVHNFFYYLWKLFIPLIFTIFVILVFNFFVFEVNHKDIAVTLVSTNSIITAFLVLSLTVLLTQEIKNLPNSNIDYRKFLVTNVEVSVILVLFSILSSITYMLLSSSTACDNNYYMYLLNFLCYLSIFLTFLVIKLTIDDLLLLSSKLK